MFEMRMFGRRKSLSGMRGATTRDSITMKAASTSSAPPSIASVCPEVQPAWLPLTIAYTASISAAVIVTAPARSSRVPAAALPDGRRRSDSSTTPMPIGMLTRKIQCQSSTSVSTPPSRTPMLPPPAATKPKIPIAFARSDCSVKSVIVSERPTADTTAPPSPCTARAPINKPCDVDSPHASDASVKSEMPPRNRRRLPNRSPRRPPSSKKPPKVSRYALTTQASDVSEKPRSLRMDGSATFTIVLSRTIISVPKHRTIRANQRLLGVISVIVSPLLESLCPLDRGVPQNSSAGDGGHNGGNRAAIPQHAQLQADQPQDVAGRERRTHAARRFELDHPALQHDERIAPLVLIVEPLVAGGDDDDPSRERRTTPPRDDTS